MNSRALRHSKGFTLVEMMIALLLGLLVLGAVISVLLANSQAYRTNAGLAQIQDNARVAFEFMARDLRKAGGNPCGAPIVVNVLNTPNAWWADWANNALRGYDNSAANDAAHGIVPVHATNAARRVAGTDAILVMSGEADPVVITNHAPPRFTVNSIHSIDAHDILMVCDTKSAAIFQATRVIPANRTIDHEEEPAKDDNERVGNRDPDNDPDKVAELGFPMTQTTDTPKTFQANGFVGHLTSSFWYIGNNPRGGRSLYRRGTDGKPTQQTLEMAEGVTDMQIEYLRKGDASYIVAGDALLDTPLEWLPNAANPVIAVRIILDLESTDAVGSDGQTLKRQLMHVVTLRNRAP
jgi:type IV pilus assembly protein PilW